MKDIAINYFYWAKTCDGQNIPGGFNKGENSNLFQIDWRY